MPKLAVVLWALAASAVATAATTAYTSSASATNAKKAADNQANTANSLAAQNKIDQAKLEADSKANQDKLAAAPGIAEEQARIEDMKRRQRQTKTLLTGPLGTTDTATTEKKTLLGA